MTLPLPTHETPGVQSDLAELIGLRYHARHLPHRAKQKGHHSLSGVRLAQPLGRGLEFDQVRLYQPGDDVAMMDWKVTARTTKPHVKQYRVERERPVIIVVDQRNSMFFGSRQAFKSVVAARLAALAAWLAVDQGERLGSAVITDEQVLRHPIATGAQSTLRLLQSLSQMTPPQHFASHTPLNGMLQKILPMIQPRCLVVLLSDFVGIDKETRAILWQWRRHCQIVAGFIYDTLEKNPPPPDVYPMSDGIQEMNMDLTQRETSQYYQKQFAKHFYHLQTLCRESGIPLHSIATHQDIFASPLTYWLCHLS